jgi:hypothetical protein
LSQYASKKRLPEDFLRDLGLRDSDWFGTPALVVPYFDQDGEEVALRYRLAMNGRDSFRWQRGTDAKGLVYGLDRWKQAAAEGRALVSEGESDTQTAWFHGLPAFGIPGANMVEDERTGPALEGIGELYVVQEPGRAGEAFVESLKASRLGERVRPVSLGEHKDK